MGWFRDDPAHEGHVVALTPNPGCNGFERARELRYPDDETEQPVRVFQVGCACGWRSRRFHAPRGARWYPFHVDLHDEAVDELASRIWREHYDQETAADRRGLWPAEEHDA
jgi:hypothetical protein